jgi:hypothetical protein
MQTTVLKKTGWHVVNVEHLFLVEYDIEKYVRLVKQLLRDGYKNIALSITPHEYPYLKFLSLLLRCHIAVQQFDGKLVVIQSNEDFLETVQATHLHNLIRFMSSEEELENNF